MTDVRSSAGEGSAIALSAADRARLVRQLEVAARRARGRHRNAVLASITVDVPASVDPSAVVAAGRRPGESWFCFEQPERDGAAVAALGSVIEFEARGAARFTEVAARWRSVLAAAASDGRAAVSGAGPIAVGGFAFADNGGASPEWSGFAPASLVVPEVAFARRGGRVQMTLSALVGGDDDLQRIADRVEARLATLDADARLPALEPDPIGRHRVVSLMPPEHYVEAVRQATERIRSGVLQKIVLARAVEVHAPVAHKPEAVLGILREGFSGCHLFCVGRGDATFVAASPELLIRREGLRAATLALAGSTRRSADPAVDNHLGEQLLRSEKDRGEQEIVTKRIVRALQRHAVWVTAAEEPGLARMANIQHLATPIRAQLRSPVSAVELVGQLHPTPAVGGEPLSVASPLIPALEGMDRGWYAGPVGWTDAGEDGEFVVGLRSALIRGAVGRCYAGVGVVADSDPAAELAETEIKLEALLPVLSL